MEVSTSSLYEKLSKALKDNNDLIKECQDVAAGTFRHSHNHSPLTFPLTLKHLSKQIRSRIEVIFRLSFSLVSISRLTNLKKTNKEATIHEFEFFYRFIQDIQNGKIKLLAFVEELGPFLTDKNPTARAQGTLALSATLRQLPKDFLNETELNFITTFYCDRMKDNFEVIPFVLQGILAIVSKRLDTRSDLNDLNELILFYRWK